MNHKSKTIFSCTPRFFITWFLLAALACIIYALVVFGSLVSKTVVPSNNVPKTIPYITIPSKYDVYLQFDSTPSSVNKMFQGSLFMTFVARDVTQRLFLHRGDKLKITLIEIDDGNGTISQPTAGAFDKSTDVQAYIPVSNLTTDNTYVLHMEFTGELDNVALGPNHLSYSLQNGTNRNAVIFGHTVSQTIGLRYLIPCLDSQDFPAEFNFNIRHSPQYQAISNFVGYRQESSQFTATVFNSTFATSPYQIAFALVDTAIVVEQMRYENLTISKYFQQFDISTISSDRIIQFMGIKTVDIGKIDVLSLPGLITVQQPGISFLDSHDVLRENIDLGLINTT